MHCTSDVPVFREQNPRKTNYFKALNAVCARPSPNEGELHLSPCHVRCGGVRDHPQMKGNCTLQAPALAVLTGLLQAAMEKLLPTYNRLGNLLARWTHHKSQHMYWR